MRFGQMEAHRPILVLISEGFASGASDLDLDHVLRASSLYHFPIYSFNPADHKGDEAMLRRLAEQTGGLFIDVDNSIAGFARIAHDTEAYYSLTYRPSSGDDDTLHAIEVRVKREAGIRTRTAYWPDAAGEKSALAALPPASPAVPQRPLRRSPLVDVWVGIRRNDDSTNQMTVTWEPRPGQTQTARSVRLKAQGQSLTGRVLFDGPIASASAARFAAPSGRLELDLEIRDDTNQVVDTDARDVDVPDWRSTTTATTKTGPRLLPIEIIRARSARDAQRTDDPDAAPTASRTFMRTNVLLIRAPAYDPSGAAVQMNVHLLNVAGRLLSDIPQTNGTFVIPLASLAPGVYQLEVIASNTNGRVATRVEFRITD
jgi:hypothetical protein